ncbi:MAG TPA: 2-dehydro-3-deoxyphosphogluconate aldolase, partial [Armatimonadota bacterium]|nr:2-dehydro-3-deoxyphosphogluconate aldolase [Armatimonadota bacterium]
MRDRQSTLRRILDSGIVAVMRARSSEHLIGVADAIRAGGVDCIEVTMTTPNALGIIEQTARTFGDDAVIGVGTVLDAESARAAILAGAQFIVAPTLNPDVIRMAHRYDKAVIPGG